MLSPGSASPLLSAAQPTPPTRALVTSAACASGIALAVQVWSIRLLSNLIWDQFAATIVAGGMAGYALGALRAGRQHRRSGGIPAVRLDRGFLLLSLTLYGYWFLLTKVEFEPYRAFLLHDARSMLELGVLGGTILLLTAATGWLLAHTVALSGERLRTVYSADLFGGCAGVCAAVLLGAWIGPLQGILLCATAALLGAERMRATFLQRRFRLARALGAAAACAPLLLLWNRGALHFPEGKFLHGLEPFVERTVWDPAVRIDVLNLAQGQFDGSGGIAKPKPEDEMSFRLVLQDGGAPTAILGLAPGDVEQRGVWRKYLQAAPFTILQQPRVLILGPGGGLEIAISAHFEAASIECVEINASLIRLCREDYRDFQSNLWGRPEVSVHWGDGRHFLARTHNEYDLIIMCGVDSFAAGPGGASTAVENFLYTTEAVAAMLDRLSEHGVLAVTRRLLNPERESLRFVATLAEAFATSGRAGFADSISLLEGPATGSGVAWAMMMAKPSGFTVPERQRLKYWAAEQGHRLMLGNSTLAASPFDRLVSATPAERERFLTGYPFNIRPVSDDRPYFFLTARSGQMWKDSMDLLRGSVSLERLQVGSVPPAAGLLVGFAVAALLAVLALAVLGMFWWRSRRSGSPAPARPWLYFALTGCGTLLAEIGLFQVGTFLLGMPFLAVGIVLAAVLLGAGLGARSRLSSARIVTAAGVLMLMVTIAWASKLALGWPPPGLLIGALILAALGAGLGFLSGSFFPCGLRCFPGFEGPERRAQAFALASAFSVAGAAAGPVIAIVMGTRALLGASALGLFGAAALLARRRRSASGSAL